MLFFLDGEWNGYKGDLISMALVGQDCEWYEVLDCPNPDPWVLDNVIPKLDKEPVTLEQMRASLQQFLCRFLHVGIVADWPEDIARFCELLVTGPGQRMDTPPLSFFIDRRLNSDASEKPHQALADARAMMEMFMRLEPR